MTVPLIDPPDFPYWLSILRYVTIFTAVALVMFSAWRSRNFDLTPELAFGTGFVAQAAAVMGGLRFDILGIFFFAGWTFVAWSMFVTARRVQERRPPSHLRREYRRDRRR